MRLLWVSSEERPLTRAEIRHFSESSMMCVEHAAGPAAAFDAVRGGRFDAVLTELPLARWTAEEWLEQLRRAAPGTPCVFRSAGGSVSEAVRLTRLGAAGYLSSGDGIDALARAVRLAAEDKTGCPPQEQEPWRRLLVGESRAMCEIANVVRLAGPRRSTVLVTGETGTGKELVARAVHMASPRAHLPMVAVNCNAIPETLLDAELFGHVRGAFTGALGQRAGRFEQAHRSTLFLDEIGDMPFELQAKLLRVLQEREIQRLGSSESVRLDVRLIAATNCELEERIGAGGFREDLYFRLNVIAIRVPPLRERATDIPLLAEHFVEKTCRAEGLGSKRIARDALYRLCDYAWPGNVRQLENAVEAAIVLSGERAELHALDFPLPKMPGQRCDCATRVPIEVPDTGLDFERTVSAIERSILEQALVRTRGNKKAAAEMLRLKRTTLSAKLKSLEAVAV